MNSSTSSSEPRRYTILLLLAALLPLVLVPLFVAAVDPYDSLGTPRIDGINASKPWAKRRPHYPKMAAILQANPRSVLLGSSRVGDGLDPSHPLLLQPAFNLGYGGHTWQDSLDLLEELLSRKGSALRQVVLHVDAFNNNAVLLRQPSLARSALDAFADYGFLLSAESRADAWKTLTGQDEPYGRYIAGFYREEGDGSPKSLGDLEYGMARDVFLAGNRCEPLAAGRSGRPMDVLARVLALAYRHDLELYIVIGPSHARIWELESALGLADGAADWKRELVRRNEELALASGRPPFPFWDFSGFNQLTMEPVAHGQRRLLQWHYESSHFRPEAGAIVLDRMLGRSDVAGAFGDIGVVLTIANIEKHLRQQREMQARWRAANPVDVEQVAAVVARLAAARGCRFSPAAL